MQPNMFEEDAMLVRLAREIALDHYELGDILKRFAITPERWARISQDRYFVSLLTSEIEAWNQTTNTTERSKLKAAALIEEWLPEAHVRLHDKTENLNSKVALATLVSKIAGMGGGGTVVEGGGGEKFVVNINLGEQKSITLNTAPARIEREIEASALPVKR